MSATSLTRFHLWPLDEGHWWACEHPERRVDHKRTWFVDECRGCSLALGAAAMAEPDDLIARPTTGETWTLVEAYEIAREIHDLPSLPARSGSLPEPPKGHNE